MLSLVFTLLISPITPMADVITAAESYPLGICAVSGKKLGSMGAPIELVHEGRQIRFCCQGCVPAFKKEPAKFIGNIDKKIIEAQKQTYPLDTCVVSGEKLAGKTKSVVVNNRLVKVCCGGCVKKIKGKLPAKFTALLDQAIVKRQSKKYPLKACVISGEPLGSMGPAKNVIVGNTLVKVCCKGCIKKVALDPAKYIKVLKFAAKGDEKKKDAKKGK
ncbi:MAG: hypothetical protein OSB09_11175 [Planctomycetota bacterium]|nr:hypothetical protein [Planctomycetota bacterium]